MVAPLIRALAALGLVGTVAAASPNLVANGSFESVVKGQPVGWAAFGAGLTQTLTLDRGRTGGRCAKLACTEIAKGGGDRHSMLGQVGRIAVKKGGTYRFSGWFRAEHLRGRQVTVALKDTQTWDSVGLEVPVRLTRAWRRFETTFTATSDVSRTSRLQIWFTETGTLWVDDVVIVAVAPAKLSFTSAIAPGTSRNLIPNGSFEAGTDGWGSLGIRCGWGNLTGLFGEVVSARSAAGPGNPGGATAAVPDGTKCLKIELGPGKTPVTWFDYFEPSRVDQVAPLAANLGWIKVKRQAKYTLSAWMRSDPPGVPATLFVSQRDAGSWAQTDGKEVVLTGEWARYSYTVDTRKGSLFVAVGPDLRRGSIKAATVFIDAIQLEPGRAPTAFVPRDPVEIGITTARYGNVFTRGEPVVVTVSGRNTGAKPATVSLKATGTDFFGAKLPPSTITLAVPVRGSAETAWTFTPPGKGVWDLAIARGTNVRQLRITVIEPYRGGDSPFGINHAPATAEWCDLLKRAGVVWARDWTLKWQTVEPENGRFDFAAADGQIGRLVRGGFKAICLLPPFPSSNWASSAPDGLDLSGYPGIRKKMAYAPKDPALLARFIGNTVVHLKPWVHDWEFLNEPIFTDYALPGEGQRWPGAAYTVKDYVALLKVASAAMKQADPACRVLGGIAGDADERAFEFVREGGLDAVDVMNLHIYPGKATPESFLDSFAKLAEVMRAAGKSRPIWMTEYAYYGADDPPWTPYAAGADDWAGVRLLESERECAEWSVRFAVVCLASGVEKIFTHSGGSPEVNGEGFECPFLRWGGVPRKLYAAQSAMANLLGSSPKFVSRLPAGDGVYAFAFQCGGQGVVIAWVDDDAESGWKISGPADSVILDLVGNPRPSGPAVLSGSPLYLVSDRPAAAVATACTLKR